MAFVVLAAVAGVIRYCICGTVVQRLSSSLLHMSPSISIYRQLVDATIPDENEDGDGDGDGD